MLHITTLSVKNVFLCVFCAVFVTDCSLLVTVIHGKASHSGNFEVQQKYLGHMFSS